MKKGQKSILLGAALGVLLGTLFCMALRFGREGQLQEGNSSAGISQDEASVALDKAADAASVDSGKAADAASVALDKAADAASADSDKIADAAPETELLAVTAWAEAFCGRDGKTLAGMCSTSARESLTQASVLDEAEGIISFGWSSPWPWNAAEMPDYRVLTAEEGQAQILYYAHVSDPHVSVWREELTYQWSEDGLTVEEETLEFLDGIDTGEAYARAYPAGINHTPMDYLATGDWEALDAGAKAEQAEERREGAYQAVCLPETAALYLLNLKGTAETMGEIYTTREQTPWQEQDNVLVTVILAGDHSTLSLHMVRPKGAVVWLPQDALMELQTEAEQ